MEKLDEPDFDACCFPPSLFILAYQNDDSFTCSRKGKIKNPSNSTGKLINEKRNEKRNESTERKKESRKRENRMTM